MTTIVEYRVITVVGDNEVSYPSSLDPEYVLHLLRYFKEAGQEAWIEERPINFWQRSTLGEL